jgi:hypothetical protein
MSRHRRPNALKRPSARRRRRPNTRWRRWRRRPSARWQRRRGRPNTRWRGRTNTRWCPSTRPCRCGRPNTRRRGRPNTRRRGRPNTRWCPSTRPRRCSRPNASGRGRGRPRTSARASVASAADMSRRRSGASFSRATRNAALTRATRANAAGRRRASSCTTRRPLLEAARTARKTSRSAAARTTTSPPRMILAATSLRAHAIRPSTSLGRCTRRNSHSSSAPLHDPRRPDSRTCSRQRSRPRGQRTPPIRRRRHLPKHARLRRHDVLAPRTTERAPCNERAPRLAPSPGNAARPCSVQQPRLADASGVRPYRLHSGRLVYRGRTIATKRAGKTVKSASLSMPGTSPTWVAL